MGKTPQTYTPSILLGKNLPRPRISRKGKLITRPLEKIAQTSYAPYMPSRKNIHPCISAPLMPLKKTCSTPAFPWKTSNPFLLPLTGKIKSLKYPRSKGKSKTNTGLHKKYTHTEISPRLRTFTKNPTPPHVHWKSHSPAQKYNQYPNKTEKQK